MRVAGGADRARVLDPAVRGTPLWGAVQMDRLHATFLRMNGSGVIFVAALNGSALGLGRNSLGPAICASWLMGTSSSATRRCSSESIPEVAAPSD
jgi:hypothetical protein